MTEQTLDGKVCLITGANTGIGRVTALRLADMGARIIVTARTAERAMGVLNDIRNKHGEERAVFLELELDSLTKVKRSAEAFLKMNLPLHLLVLNAGAAGVKGQSVDGFESTFAINHLGHFLFVEWLRPLLVANAPGRIVFVSSRAHKRIRRLDFESFTKPTSTKTGFEEYSTSKACNIFHSRKLAKLLEGTGVTTYALHPGVVRSDIWRRIPQPFRYLVTRKMITVEEGAETTVYCASDPSLDDSSGLYYDKSQLARLASWAEDESIDDELWQRSLEWVRPFLPTTTSD